MKRKTETNKWNDGWYLALTPLAKLLLVYLYDNCDEAGFIDPIWIKWETEIGASKENLSKALVELQKALLSNKKKLFIKDFLLHQEKIPLNPTKKQDRWIISKLESNLPKFNNNIAIADILDTKILKVDSTPITPVVEPATRTKKIPETKKFVKPELEEFKEYYFTEKPEAIEADIINLYDYYESCGWKVGNKPMKDWNAAIRTSIRRDEKWQEGKSKINESRKQDGESKINKIKTANEDLNIDYEQLGHKNR